MKDALFEIAQDQHCLGANPHRLGEGRWLFSSWLQPLPALREGMNVPRAAAEEARTSADISTAQTPARLINGVLAAR